MKSFKCIKGGTVWFIWILVLMICGTVFLFVFPINKSPVMGSVHLRPNDRVSLQLDIPHNGRAPWRIFFYGAKLNLAELSADYLVELSLKNNDSDQLVFYCGPAEGEVLIPSGGIRKIFQGTLAQLARLGSTGQEELIVKSSSRRKVSATLYFVCPPNMGSVELIARLTYTHYWF
jgi:hypothetical protein